MDEKDIWTSVLSKIKEEINSLSFQTWFEETELYRLEKNVANHLRFTRPILLIIIEIL